MTRHRRRHDRCASLAAVVLAAAASLGVGVAAAAGDVIRLKDGTVLEGDVKRHPDGGWTVTSPGGHTRHVARKDVKSIEATGGAATRGAVDENLQSLRRSVENVDDPAVAIEKYERFLAAHPTSEVSGEAQRELATWLDRRDRGLVRVGSDWLTPEQRAERQAEGVAIASEARQLIKGGRLPEAERVIRQALEADPKNPAAWYLRGLLAYRADKMPEARRAFEQVNAAVPSHAPTLNNLAVVLFRQRQYGGAMTYYDQAMQASPNDREILDNVAEALEALDDTAEASTAAQKAARRFRSQDQQLQERMAALGLYRWGATWVNQTQMDRLREAERRIQERLDALAGEFDRAKDAIEEIDEDIESNERSMRQIEATSYVRDRYGGVRRAALPSIYYELQRDTEKLRRDQAALVARQEELRAAAKAAQADVPVPRFSGVQKLIETEGTPIAVPEAPTTG